MEGIQIEAGEFGPRAVLTSHWSDDKLNVCLENNVVELELNDGKGWRGTDVGFLLRLPALSSLEIRDLGIRDLGAIHFLHKLRRLDLIAYSKNTLRFDQFPELRRCALVWQMGAESVFSVVGLERLFVDGYPGPDLRPFGSLAALEDLTVANGALASLAGIQSLTRMRRLRLVGLKRLQSLAGIEHLRLLQELDLNTCRDVHSIGEVAGLKHLKFLGLNNMGSIDSLKPIRQLELLEVVTFYESTNIVDGDLSPLAGKSRLARVAFMNRRHYTHRREDFAPKGTR